MANLLAFVHLEDGKASDGSRFALGEARRIANQLGSTVYAVVVTGPVPSNVLEELARSLGQAGTDKVLCCADVRLAQAPSRHSWGPVVTLLGKKLYPLLVLVAAGSPASTLAADLAADMALQLRQGVTLDIELGSYADAPDSLRLVLRAETGARPEAVGADNRVFVTLQAGLPPDKALGFAAELDLVSYPET